MKKLIAMLFVMTVGISAAQAGEVAYTVGSVKDRVTQANGNVLQISTNTGALGFGLQSLSVANSNRTEADVSYTLVSNGLTGTAGVGAVAQTGVTSHAVYFARGGYDYDFGNKVKVGAGIGYKNDFQRSVADRQVTYEAKASYAFTDATTVGLGFTRYNGDLHLNQVALTCNTKF